MVNKKDERSEPDDIELTEHTDITEPELEEIEENVAHKIKSIRAKLTAAETQARDAREELQRAKADFLNAKRRLEDERVRERQRVESAHIEKLLPLCDSFYLAMLDKAAWEKSDETWRKGVEGIYAQLTNVIASYGVRSFDPTGEAFDPIRHEALGNTNVDSNEMHHKVVSVIQLGYERTVDGTTVIIRPARVMVGEYTAS